MNKFFLTIIIFNLNSISYANYLDDWSNEDLCRWMDADLIPEYISDEANMRDLSCYVSCFTGDLTANIPYCNENNNGTLYLLELNMTDKDGGNENLFLSNPVFNGIDMSGYTPPGVGSMDSRIYYINGHQQMGGSTQIRSLKRYLESTGQGSVFSLDPPVDCESSESPRGIKPPSYLTNPSSPDYISGLLESWLGTGCITAVEVKQPNMDGGNENLFLSNPVFNGIDMSGYNPSQIQSSDMRRYFINGQLQTGSTTGADELKRYLEFIGRGDVFSYNPPAGYVPPKIQPPIPIKFNFEITL